MLSAEQQQKAIGALLQRKENSVCAQCGGKSPCWASLDFGVFICMNCAGAHRALGPSITRVKSTKLDTWNKEWLENMRLGNIVVNQYWEKQIAATLNAKPNINSSLNDIIKFVQEKYVNRKFADPKHDLDPLKRPKQMHNVRSQSLQTSHSSITPKVSKQTPKAQVKSNIECPFSAFDNIIASKIKQEKSTKPAENLISFEETRKPNHLSTNQQTEPQQKQRHNHQQFYSVSGTATKHKQQSEPFLNFDTLVKQSISNKEKPAKEAVISPIVSSMPNYMPTMPNSRAQLVSKLMSNNTQDILTYDRSQFSTMYPKPPANSYLSQLSSQGKGSMKITLESNIDFSMGQVKKQQPRSWVDEWK